MPPDPKKPTGFAAEEAIGIGIPNPRAVRRIPVPDDLTPEQLAALEKEIDRVNALIEIQDGLSRAFELAGVESDETHE
jgi:hypothetical protein